MRWPWSRPAHSHDEALEQLARLAELDPEIDEMGKRLRDTRAANNFSGMVDAAIRRAARTGR